jgi:hypothetical protein
MRHPRDLPVLSLGQIVDNRTVALLGGGRLQGGIRYSGSCTGAINRAAIVLGNAGDAPYRDRRAGQRITYTGEGPRGNQSMTRGNLVLARHPAEGFPLCAFERIGCNAYVYLGPAKVTAYRTETQVDEVGSARTVYVFDVDVELGGETAAV